MVRKLIKRMGAVRATLLVTASLVLTAVVLGILAGWVFKGTVLAADVLIVAIIPVLLAPLMIRGFIRLSHELDMAQELVQILATEDSLTGVHNRRHFFHLAELEIENSKRYGRPLTLLIIDVDHFKSVNDSYGHSIGDRALQRIAAICREKLRKTDIIGRYGGEEFAVLLTETYAASGIIVAERIRTRLEATPIDIGDRQIFSTVSIGVASFKPGFLNIDQLLTEAELALVNAKQQGRNRVLAAP